MLLVCFGHVFFLPLLLLITTAVGYHPIVKPLSRFISLLFSPGTSSPPLVSAHYTNRRHACQVIFFPADWLPWQCQMESRVGQSERVRSGVSTSRVIKECLMLRWAVSHHLMDAEWVFRPALSITLPSTPGHSVNPSAERRGGGAPMLLALWRSICCKGLAMVLLSLFSESSG